MTTESAIPQLSLIVPVYDEEDNLKLLHERICESLTDYSFEVIYVNDGSRDSSGQVLEELARDADRNKMMIRFDPRQHTDMMRTRALARRGKEGDLGLIVVDHNKLVRLPPTVRGFMDLVSRIGFVMDELKALAKEAECPLLLLAQMTRESQKRAVRERSFDINVLRPNRDDLFGGGAMVEFADVVMLAHRPDQVLPKVQPSFNHPDHGDWMEMCNIWKDKVELVADKVRQGRPGRTARMVWNGDKTMVEPMKSEEDGLGWM